MKVRKIHAQRLRIRCHEAQLQVKRRARAQYTSAQYRYTYQQRVIPSQQPQVMGYLRRLELHAGDPFKYRRPEHRTEYHRRRV